MADRPTARLEQHYLALVFRHRTAFNAARHDLELSRLHEDVAMNGIRACDD